jgi:hypothetical protein
MQYREQGRRTGSHFDISNPLPHRRRSDCEYTRAQRQDNQQFDECQATRQRRRIGRQHVAPRFMTQQSSGAAPQATGNEIVRV